MTEYIGVKFWNDRNRYYTQENNPTEEYNRLLELDEVLETCGPTASINAIASMGRSVEIVCPGEFRPQPEAVLTDYFNDPRNAENLNKVRDLSKVNIPRNRVPQYYPSAVWDVFSVKAWFGHGVSWKDLTNFLYLGKPVQICLRNPSHYVTIVAYTPDIFKDGKLISDGYLIYNDPWGSRFSDGNGFNRLMFKEELRNNVKSYRIVYSGDV